MNNTFEKLIKKEQCLQIIGPGKNEGHLYKNELPTIFVDGGIKHQKKYSAKKSISLGDGDSAKQKLQYVFPLKSDKSDLKLALDLFGKHAKTLFLDGFFPVNSPEKRFDHLLANIGDIYNWSKKYEGDAFLCSKMFMIPKGNHELLINGNFGIVALSSTKLKLTGDCKYQLKKMTTLMQFSSLGISNYGNGYITIHCNNPLIITTN